MRLKFNVQQLVRDLGGPLVINRVTGIGIATLYRWQRGESDPLVSNLMRISEKAQEFRDRGYYAPFTRYPALGFALDMQHYVHSAGQPRTPIQPRRHA